MVYSGCQDILYTLTPSSGCCFSPGETAQGARRATGAVSPAQNHRPSPARSSVHTLPFAFSAPQAHHESVKMSNPARSRSSAQDDATSTAILPALSDSCAGRPAPFFHAGPAHAGISPAFFGARCPQNRQFLFDTNEPVSHTSNFVTHTKQSTSFFPFDANIRLLRASNLAIHTKQIASPQITSLFLFDTNERSLFTTHQSLITNHQSLTQAKTP